MPIRYLIQKEFLQFRRNTFLPRLVLLFPVMVMCVMPWVMNMEVKNIKTVVADFDRTQQSRRLVESIRQSPYFVFAGMRHSYAEALEAIESGAADVAVEIPRGRGQVLIAANAVDGVKGSLGASYLIRALGGETLAEGGAGGGGAVQAAVSERYLYNGRLDYKVFMIPALMSILMMMLCGFLPALNIVSEKESGTIEQMNVTPVSRMAFILSKLIPYWLIGLAVLTLCFALSWAVYGIVPAGSLPLLYLISMLLALIFSGIGLIVSNHSANMQQAILVMWFIVVCTMLLSGLFTPVRSMPGWAQTLTLLTPVRHYIDAMRNVFVRGGGMASVLPQLLLLAAFATVCCGWAVISYRKRS